MGVVEMAQVFVDRVLGNVRDRDSGATFGDLEFGRCRFHGVALSETTDPRRRSTVRRVRIRDCEAIGCTIWTPIVEEVEVDGLATVGTLLAWGAAFRHVTLRGAIGSVLIATLPDAGLATPDERRAIEDANENFYADVDWALDIREAAFADVDLRGVPGRLVRRDPETQVLVTRGRALEGRWRALDLAGTYWPTALQFYLDESRWDSTVLALPKGLPASSPWDLAVLLDGLHRLQDGGIAEPD
jgi:hypothetical protein